MDRLETSGIHTRTSYEQQMAPFIKGVVKTKASRFDVPSESIGEHTLIRSAAPLKYRVSLMPQTDQSKTTIAFESTKHTICFSRTFPFKNIELSS